MYKHVVRIHRGLPYRYDTLFDISTVPPTVVAGDARRPRRANKPRRKGSEYVYDSLTVCQEGAQEEEDGQDSAETYVGSAVTKTL